MNSARKDLFGCRNELDITGHINKPEEFGMGTYKCTVIYHTDIVQVNFEPYKKRKIESLKMITDNDIDYSFKYLDRSSLNTLFDLRGECDEILIVKNGFITDTSFSNIAFYDGTSWVTPNTPLLKGTMREMLLAEGLIFEKEITVNDLPGFQKASLINCMLDLDSVVIPVQNIVL